MGELLLVFALFCFSVAAFVVRAASVRLGQNIGFLVALVANVGFGSVLFLVFQVLRSSAFHVDAWAVGIFAVGGVFSSYRGRRGYFRTVHTIGPSRASAIQNSSPVFAFAFAWVFLGQTLSATDVALIAAVTVGLYFAGRTSGVGGPVRGRGTDRLFPSSSEVPVREFLVPLVSAAAMRGQRLPWCGARALGRARARSTHRRSFGHSRLLRRAHLAGLSLRAR